MVNYLFSKIKQSDYLRIISFQNPKIDSTISSISLINTKSKIFFIMITINQSHRQNVRTIDYHLKNVADVYK